MHRLTTAITLAAFLLAQTGEVAAQTSAILRDVPAAPPPSLMLREWSAPTAFFKRASSVRSALYMSTTMNKETHTQHVVWTGILEVVGKPGCELIPADQGAFIRVFAWASSPAHFSERAIELMEHYKLLVLGIQDIETAEDRDYGKDTAVYIESHARALETKGIIFGTFDLYPLKDGPNA